MSHLCVLFAATVTSWTTLNAQKAPSQVSLGLRGVAASGRESGSGYGADAELRWQPKNVRWLTLVARANYVNYGRVLRSTNDQNLLPALRPSFGDYSLNSATRSIVIGPEFSKEIRRVGAYFNLLAGVADVATDGDFLRYRVPAFGGLPAQVSEEYGPLPIDRRNAVVATLTTGTGLRTRVGRRMQLDAGVRRTFSGSTTWQETGLMYAFLQSIDAPFPPTFNYKRRVDAWIWHAGFAISP